MVITHILIAFAYLLGVAYDAMSKVGRVRKKHPTLGFNETWSSFFQEEWNTIMVSGLGWATVQFAWYIIHSNKVPLPEWIELWGIYPIALLFGYALQRLIYKFLGTFEGVLEDKAKGFRTIRGGGGAIQTDDEGPGGDRPTDVPKNP